MLSMAMFRLFAKFDVMHAYEPYASWNHVMHAYEHYAS